MAWSRRDWGGGDRAQTRFAGAGRCRPFSETDGFAVRTQPVGMVEVDGGDNGQVGIVGIDGVEPPAQADFQDDGLDPSGGEDLPGGQGAEL